MATVPMSTERRNRIQRHIQSMAKKDLAIEISDWKETSDTDASQLLTLLQFAPFYELAEKTPRDWLYPMRDYQASVIVLPREPKLVPHKQYSSTVMRKEHLEPLFTLRFPNTTQAFIRPGGDAETYVWPDRIQELVCHPTYGTVPGLAELVTNLKLVSEVAAHREKWEKIETQLTKLLQSVGTINAAVKALPELKFYLPDDIVAKLAEQTQKSKARQADLASLDLDMVVSTGVSAALSQKE